MSASKGRTPAGLKRFRVGVFPPEEDLRVWRAYTRDFNPTWPGCQVFEVQAANGTEAKRMAIALAKRDAVAQPSESRAGK